MESTKERKTNFSSDNFNLYFEGFSNIKGHFNINHVSFKNLC